MRKLSDRGCRNLCQHPLSPRPSRSTAATPICSLSLTIVRTRASCRSISTVTSLRAPLGSLPPGISPFATRELWGSPNQSKERRRLGTNRRGKSSRWAVHSATREFGRRDQGPSTRYWPARRREHAGRGGTIFTAALPSNERQVQADMRTHLYRRPARDIIIVKWKHELRLAI